MFKKIINKFFDKSLPVLEDDIFVVSYPKSGNTWTRFVLSHLIIECKEQLNFKNFDKYIPDYEVHHELIKEMTQEPRMMKSHSAYQAKFKKVIYIIRDPRDVYVSYYHYLKKRLPENMDFYAFLRDDSVKTSWAEHVKSWEKHDNKLILRYEDMLAKPIETFSRILDFTPDMNWNRELLQKAVEMSSFKTMKKVEKEHGRNFLSKDAEQKSSTFMRKGTKGDWVNYFNEEDLEYLKQKAGGLLEKYNYL